MKPLEPSHEPPRESKRVPLVREVVLEFDDFRGFIAEYSKNISMGGMFIKSETPKEPGEVFSFKFRLADGFQLIQGRGQVVWKREVAEGPGRPAGMGIRFLDIDDASRQLIGRMVDEHQMSAGVGSEFPPDGLGFPGAPEPGDAEAWQAPEVLQEPTVPIRESSSPTLAEILQAPPLEPSSGAEPGLLSETPAESVRPPTPSAQGWAAASAARESGSGRRVAGLLTLALVLGVGLLYLFRDRVDDLLGGRIEAFLAAESAEEPVTEGAPEGGEEQGSELEPAQAGRPAAAAPAAGVEAVAAGEEPAQPPLERGSFSVIERIEWRREGGGLVVELRADGVVGSADYDILRLDRADSPRVLVRLKGVDQAYPRPNLAVGTPEVRQIRTGFHTGGGINELHVVFDLASGQIRLSGVEDGSPILRLHFRAG